MGGGTRCFRGAAETELTTFTLDNVLVESNLDGFSGAPETKY